MPETTSEIRSFEQVRRDFQRILNLQPDIGAARIMAGWFSNRPNIFDPHSRRQLKPEILIVLSYALFIALVSAAFNSR